jgi:hypothetical protein
MPQRGHQISGSDQGGKRADEPRKISSFDNIPLLELIVSTGIAEAINRMPDAIKSSKGAIAVTIENNVRSKIIKEHLNDPAFYKCLPTSRLADGRGGRETAFPSISDVRCYYKSG